MDILKLMLEERNISIPFMAMDEANPEEDTHILLVKKAERNKNNTGGLKIGMCPEYPPFESETRMGIEVEFENTSNEELVRFLKMVDFADLQNSELEKTDR